jgi:ketosteroid isomerase-like protein
MKIFFVVLLSLWPVLAFAQEPTAEQALNTVVENEGKFAQMSQDQNTRAAFLEFLAPDAIVFHPGPVNGPELWKKRPENYISLKWKPLFAAIARSADLAYTTGPAEWREKKEDPKPYGYAQFVSVWKKQKDGAWKVALDIGNEVPGPVKGDEPPPLELSLSPAPANVDLADAKKKLQQAESLFATAAKADSTIALTEAGAANLRVHREGVFPAIGKGAATLMLSVRRGKLTLERSGGGMSAAGDLAYSYGKYSLVRPQDTERGHFLQIWRMEADGSWKIALDYEAPLPPETKKPAK